MRLLPPRTIIIGDLHRAAGPEDPFDADEACIAFLTEQAQRAGRHEQVRLVVLGDLLDFVATPSPRGGPDATEAGALGRLERIAESHGAVLEAFGDVVAAGGTLELVAGNHDVDLVRPAVQARLHELLGAPPAHRVHVHPWILHIPGLLYAEHGHQHHDINAFATLLDPFRDDDPEALDLPLGAELAHVLGREDVAPWRRRAQFGGVLARRAVDVGARKRVREYRTSGLVAEAERTSLDTRTLAAIDAVTPRSSAAMAARLGRRTIGLGRHPSAFLHRAAGAIHELLAAQGQAVPFYAFGHSHVAERRPLLPGQLRPMYLNPGTWSRLRRGPATRCEHGYIEIVGSTWPPVARVLSWPPGD
jgi:hypothetical protein